MFQPSARLRASLLAGLMGFVAPTGSVGQTADDLASMSLENLMDLRVTSVARREESLQRAAAAIYVITQEDIRRSGATDIADVLRSVPGLHVAQINHNVWAISARGFAAQYSKKMLVLVDGRTVYDPAFSGVYWHLQNLVLSDIDRIEVIRGPGATMWGSNAVNGVINVTTKAAADTQNGLLDFDAGTARPAEGTLRYGGSLGESAFYRVFGRQTTRSSLETETGNDGVDAWRMTSGGLRLDWDVSERDSLTVDAEIYDGHQESRRQYLAELMPLRFETVGRQGNSGGHLRARLDRSTGEDSSLSFQVFYDQRRHTGFGANVFHVVDFETHYDVELGERHHLSVGGGYRVIHDDVQNGLAFGYHEPHLDSSLSSLFLQDEISLVGDELHLTVGGMVERSSFTGFNLQPTVRLSWHPAIHHTVWGAVSHAVRTANRVERDMYVNLDAFPAGSSLGVVTLFGRPETRSETLNALEVGYRYQSSRRLWLDLATFYNLYDDLSTIEPGEPYFLAEPPAPRLVTPLYFGNDMRGATYGAEIAVNYDVTDTWTLRGNYSWLDMRLEGRSGLIESSSFVEGTAPHHQAYVGSFFRLPASFELAGHVYFVDRLPAVDVAARTRVGLDLTWNGPGGVALSLVGQNLEGGAVEYTDYEGTPTSVIGRRVFGRIVWSF